MPEDWSDLRGQHERDLRRRSDDRIQSLEDSRDRGPEPRRGVGHNGNGNSRLWGAFITLGLAFIIGGIVLYREVGELRAAVKANADWIEYFKQHLPRERR